MDTIKTAENHETRHCEKRSDEVIHEMLKPQMDCRIRSRSHAITSGAVQSGNAMVYVLIAIAMFGFLTMTLSRSNDQADGQDISDEQAEFYANELMEYAASAQAVVDMMIISGSEIDDLDFVVPSDAAFNTPPHHHKVYHPQGGGLNFQFEFNEAIIAGPSAGWYIRNDNKVEWTTTNENDVILTALRVSKKICEIINIKIAGSNSIPTTGSGLNRLFDPSNAAPDNLTSATCPNCEGFVSLCVQNITDLDYGFYNIIAAQ